jgi:hypothetical protein
LSDHVAARKGGLARLWASFQAWRKAEKDRLREAHDSMERLTEHALYWKKLAEGQAKTILDLEAKLRALQPKRKKGKRK